MAKPLDVTDDRVQWVLRAVGKHPDCSISELWFLELQGRFSGYTGEGSFNFGFIERMAPRLHREGYVEKGERHRFRLTEKGEGSIRPLAG